MLQNGWGGVVLESCLLRCDCVWLCQVGGREKREGRSLNGGRELVGGSRAVRAGARRGVLGDEVGEAAYRASLFVAFGGVVPEEELSVRQLTYEPSWAK